MFPPANLSESWEFRRLTWLSSTASLLREGKDSRLPRESATFVKLFLLCLRVYPARAGIDLWIRSIYRWRRGLPRTRGDRPVG